MSRVQSEMKKAIQYEINLNTYKSHVRYERNGDDRVSFLRTIERDRFGKVVRDKEFQVGTMCNFYWKPPPTLMERGMRFLKKYMKKVLDNIPNL